MTNTVAETEQLEEYVEDEYDRIASAAYFAIYAADDPDAEPDVDFLAEIIARFRKAGRQWTDNAILTVFQRNDDGGYHWAREDQFALACAAAGKKTGAYWDAPDEDTPHPRLVKARESLQQLDDRIAAASPPLPAGLPVGNGRPTFSGVRKPPQWLCQDVLAKGKKHMLHAAWGAAKSVYREELMACSLLGREFLGRKIAPLRWMVIDGEQDAEEIEARWLALGMTQEHLQNVHLTTMTDNPQLGTATWNDYLAREVESFKPDVIVIDSILACCAKASQTNEGIIDVFDTVINPLVVQSGAALLFTHHNSERGKGLNAASGGVQWSGQSSLTYETTKLQDIKITKRSDLRSDTYSRFALAFQKSGRGAYLVEQHTEFVELKGIQADDGSIDRLRFDLADSTAVTNTDKLLAALVTPLGRGALADAAGLPATGTAFRTALAELLESSKIVKNDDNLYERVSAD